MKILLASETKPLGQLLRERGLISEEDLKNALVLQQERTDKIGRILIDLGYVAERDILAVVSDQFFSGCADLGLDLRIIDLRIIDNPALADNRILHQLDHVFQANRRFRCIDDSFEFGFKTHV